MEFEKNPTKKRSNMIEMSKVYMNCLLNYCRIKKVKDSCHDIQTHVDEIIKDLNVKDRRTLGDKINQYTGCSK